MEFNIPFRVAYKLTYSVLHTFDIHIGKKILNRNGHVLKTGVKDSINICSVFNDSIFLISTGHIVCVCVCVCV